MNLLKKSLIFPQLARLSSTTTTTPTEFVNRNPRNLEQMRIARKPDGYHLEKPGRKYWHKLSLSASNRTVKAQLIHFLNGPVIEAKTSEWCLRKQLFSANDTCAYMGLGKVFAQRCLESGISEMFCDIKPVPGGKVERFLKEVINAGIKLEETNVYKKPLPWDKLRPEKPWEVVEE